ncbi:MAG: hypothetical protein HRT35_21540 [Algicola sp.]|nr:hypothetical protein [Algicola sp.]
MKKSSETVGTPFKFGWKLVLSRGRELPKPGELFNVFGKTGKNPNTQTLAALNEVGGTSYGSVENLSQLWK